jgi:tetratricopeptide (TPR) repeat protein
VAAVLEMQLALQYDQYLLTEPAAGRYRMHDLIREHARALAGRAEPEDDRDQATARLLDYYQHTANLADTLLAHQARATPAPIPVEVPGLSDLEEALSLYRDLGNRGGAVTALNEAGTLSTARGDLRQAGSCHQQALDLARQIGSSWDEAHPLTGLGQCALAAGRTAEAEACCGRRRRSSSGSGRPRPPTFPPNSTRSPRSDQPRTNHDLSSSRRRKSSGNTRHWRGTAG